MYGLGQPIYGLQYSGPAHQLVYPSYIVPPVVVAGTFDDRSSRSSLIFPSATTTRLGTGVVRPVSWATAFPHPSPMLEVAVAPPVTNVVDAGTDFTAAEMSTLTQQQRQQPQQQQQQASRAVAQFPCQPFDSGLCHSRNTIDNGSSPATQQSQYVTSWSSQGPFVTGSLSSDVGYVDASHDSELDTQDVDFTGPRNNARGQRLSTTKDSAAAVDGVDPFVARVRIVDDDSLSTMESQCHQQLSSDVTMNWDDCRPVTATVYGNDGETDCGPETHLVSFTNDADVATFAATVATAGSIARQPPSPVAQQSLAASMTCKSSQLSTRDVNNDDIHDNIPTSSAAFIEFEREQVVVFSSSCFDGDTDLQKQAIAQPPRGNKRGQPVTGPSLVTNAPNRQQQGPILVTPPALGKSNFGGWLNVRSNHGITAREKFDTQLPTSSAAAAANGSNAVEFVDRKQLHSELRPTGYERNAASVASRPQSCYPPPSVSDLQKQLLQQMQVHQQCGGPIYYARGGISGQAGVTPAGVRPGSNRLPRNADEKELIGDAFKFLDEFDD